MAKKKAEVNLDGIALFKETAAGRITRAATVLRSVGALGHIKRYEYTPEQVKVASAFLRNAVTQMEMALMDRFENPEKTVTGIAGFSFEDKYAETGNK
jgi:hypothetical protein